MTRQMIPRAPMYDAEAVQPMRDELVAVGFDELRTADEVDRALTETPGTLLVVINSVCGCAAGSARPGVALALQGSVIPDRLATAFAGMDHEAVERVRERHLPHPPSSPSMVLFKGGQIAAMVERRQIEGRTADQLAKDLQALFARHCARPGPSIPPDDFARLDFVSICGSSIPRA